MRTILGSLDHPGLSFNARVGQKPMDGKVI